MPAKHIGPANPADIIDGTIEAHPGDTFILELAMPGPRRFMAHQYEPVAKLGERIWKNFKMLHCGNKENCVRIAELIAAAWKKQPQRPNEITTWFVGYERACEIAFMDSGLPRYAVRFINQHCQMIGYNKPVNIYLCKGWHTLPESQSIRAHISGMQAKGLVNHINAL